MDKSVDTFEQKKRFLSASYRNFKKTFFVDGQPPTPFSMLQYAPWTLSHYYNIEKARGGRNVKIGDWKLTRLTKQVFFGECLNCFCLWLKIVIVSIYICKKQIMNRVMKLELNL